MLGWSIFHARSSDNNKTYAQISSGGRPPSATALSTIGPIVCEKNRLVCPPETLLGTITRFPEGSRRGQRTIHHRFLLPFRAVPFRNVRRPERWRASRAICVPWRDRTTRRPSWPSPHSSRGTARWCCASAGRSSAIGTRPRTPFKRRSWCWPRGPGDPAAWFGGVVVARSGVARGGPCTIASCTDDSAMSGGVPR